MLARALTVKALATLGVLTLGAAGAAAATGSLPTAAQNGLANAATHVGVTLPASHDNHPTKDSHPGKPAAAPFAFFADHGRQPRHRRVRRRRAHGCNGRGQGRSGFGRAQRRSRPDPADHGGARRGRDRAGDGCTGADAERRRHRNGLDRQRRRERYGCVACRAAGGSRVGERGRSPDRTVIWSGIQVTVPGRNPPATGHLRVLPYCEESGNPRTTGAGTRRLGPRLFIG